MRRITLFSCLLLVGGLLTASPAIADHGAHPQCFGCAKKSCNLTVDTKTEETECFEVECKDICIPPVTFPWECRPKQCGRVRTVNVLTTEKRERQVCEYKWEVVVICPRCRDALHASGCEVAPGIEVLEDWHSVEQAAPSAPATSGRVQTAAPLSLTGELVE